MYRDIKITRAKNLCVFKFVMHKFVSLFGNHPILEHEGKISFVLIVEWSKKVRRAEKGEGVTEKEAVTHPFKHTQAG